MQFLETPNRWFLGELDSVSVLLFSFRFDVTESEPKEHRLLQHEDLEKEILKKWPISLTEE
jgi:hypothetical protein